MGYYLENFWSREHRDKDRFEDKRFKERGINPIFLDTTLIFLESLRKI